MSPPSKQPAKTTASSPKKGGCTPFSVQVAVLTPDDKHQINFGLTKGCNSDNTEFWTIDFLLKEQKNGQMLTRVEVHVVVGKAQQANAASLAQSKNLTPEKVDLLNGPVADRALALPPGTTSDKKLNNMLSSVIS